MSNDGSSQHKLSDAVPNPPKDEAAQGGPPSATPETIADQARLSQGGREAENTQPAQRDKLVDIGKANHMAGRSNGRRSDT